MPLHLKTTPLILALAASSTLAACAFPHGSNARPVKALHSGQSLIGGGGTVPFGIAGAARFSESDDGVSFSGLSDSFQFIPVVSYDYAFRDGDTLGADVSLLKSFSSSSDAFGVIVNPRYEHAIESGLDRDFALTVDANLGYLSTGNTGVPFISPTVGLRYYLPIVGDSGICISQQIGTAFVTLTFPGSFAIDVSIPLGEASALHLMPEVRWDPTVFFLGESSGIVAIFSGGLFVMVEL